MIITVHGADRTAIADITYTKSQDWRQAANGDANSKNLAPTLTPANYNPLPIQKAI